MIGTPARIFRAFAWIFLACIFLHPRTIHAAATPPQASPPVSFDRETFQQELDRLKSGIESARRSTDALRSLRQSLPETWAVRMGSRQYHVPTTLLGSRLQKAEQHPEIRDQQLDQARDYLDALAAEAASLPGQPLTSTDSARSKLNAILAQREFANAAQESWWDKFRARIYKFILDAINRLLSRVGGQKSLGRALLWIAISAAAVFIAFWIFRMWFRAAKVQEIALQAAAIPSRSWQEWIQAARAASAGGDYRMAVHCAYWAGIARLQDLGALAPDRTKTPREYLRALAKSKLAMPDTLAGRQQALSQLTLRLEKIWYGFHPATEADFRDSLAQLEILGCHLP